MGNESHIISINLSHTPVHVSNYCTCTYIRLCSMFVFVLAEHWKVVNMYLPDINSIQDKGGGDANIQNSNNHMVIDDEQPPVSTDYILPHLQYTLVLLLGNMMTRSYMYTNNYITDFNFSNRSS